MIIGTAGHIDHGKSTLMQALTGTHTDRLPEEKRRGISIELGYAFLDGADGQRIAFVDVPGHEKLIHTMVAGATGMDHALLLVAADDGVMPQTREHAAILSLLQVPSITVVITKTDLADADQLALVHAGVDALLKGTAHEDSPRFEVSATTGQGIEALRAHVVSLKGRPEPSHLMGFRMPVDRSFTLNGVGTVVAGTVQSGQVAVDDEVVALPGGSTAHRVRVRSLRAHNQTVTQAKPADRCALNLAALARDDCPKGAWLVAPELVHHTLRLDVQITLLGSEEKPLRSGQWVHVHWGTQDVLASVAVLRSAQPDAQAPGETGLLQLVFRQPVSAWWGDRLLLRDTSASRTLAGGFVLDNAPPARYRKAPARLAMLLALAEVDPLQRVLKVLQASELGLNMGQWAGRQGIEPAKLIAALAQHAQAQSAVHWLDERQGWAIHRTVLGSLWGTVRGVLAAFHQSHPDDAGPDVARLRRMALPKADTAVFAVLVNAWVEAGQLVRKGACLQLPEHAVTLSAVDERMAQKVMPLLTNARFDPPWVRDLAQATGEPEVMMRVVLGRLASQGQLHQVVKDLFYAPQPMAELVRIAARLHAAQGEVQAAAFRDETGLGRKRAIQILEYLDRVGVLRRVQDRHLLRTDSALLHTFMEAA